MSDRIRKTFEKKEKKLVTFTTGGDPDLDTKRKKRITSSVYGYRCF